MASKPGGAPLVRRRERGEKPQRALTAENLAHQRHQPFQARMAGPSARGEPSAPATPHPAPRTLHPKPRNPAPRTMHPTPHTLHLTPTAYTLHPAPEPRHLTLYTLYCRF